jgi:hypothetical protein
MWSKVFLKNNQRIYDRNPWLIITQFIWFLARGLLTTLREKTLGYNPKEKEKQRSESLTSSKTSRSQSQSDKQLQQNSLKHSSNIPQNEQLPSKPVSNIS